MSVAPVTSVASVSSITAIVAASATMTISPVIAVVSIAAVASPALVAIISETWITVGAWVLSEGVACWRWGLIVRWWCGGGLCGAGLGFCQRSHSFSGIGVWRNGDWDCLPLLFELSGNVERNVDGVGATCWSLIGRTVIVMRGGWRLGAVGFMAPVVGGLGADVVGGFGVGWGFCFVGPRFGSIFRCVGLLRSWCARALRISRYGV